MVSLKITGKYLDQPMLVTKFANSVPAILCASGALVTAANTHAAPQNEKKKVFTQDVCAMTGTIGSALIATRGLRPLKINGKEFFKGFEGLSENKNIKTLKLEQTALVDEFVNNNKVTDKAKTILQKVKEKVLSLKEIEVIHKDLGQSENGKKFLKELIPDPESVSSKEIFGEIGRLSLMGLVPVAGGILGGITGDKLTEKDWKEKVPNKIKEGAYQYLANIFLCNVGAGAAVAITEKMNVKSKAVKAAAMIGGIILTGVIGGSAIANYISKKCIDPLFCKKTDKKDCPKEKNLYAERKPEALDIGLHLDDVATVAVMSGLSWIEPALPILYSISGYRAGIGYRNGKEDKHPKDKKVQTT